MRILMGCQLALLCLFSTSAGAGQFIEFVGAWKPDVSGGIDTGVRALSIDSDLGVKSDGQASVSLQYETKGRWLPDFSAEYVHVGANGQYIAPNGLTLGPIVFAPGQTAAVGADFNDFDVAVDAPITIFGTRIGAGLMVKYLPGAVTAANVSTAQPILIPIDKVFPLAHLRIERSLFPWLSFNLSGAFVEYDGERVEEFRAVASVSPFRLVAITGGYLDKRYKLDTGSYHVDARFSGPTFGVSLLIP